MGGKKSTLVILNALSVFAVMLFITRQKNLVFKKLFKPSEVTRRTLTPEVLCSTFTWWENGRGNPLTLRGHNIWCRDRHSVGFQNLVNASKSDGDCNHLANVQIHSYYTEPEWEHCCLLLLCSEPKPPLVNHLQLCVYRCVFVFIWS